MEAMRLNDPTESTGDYTIQRGNVLLSYLLNCVRCGNLTQIETELSASEFLIYTNHMCGDTLSFANSVIHFLWPQIFRAAVEGGLSEMEASRIYLKYKDKSQYASSVQSLLDLHHQVFIEFTSEVATEQEVYQYCPLVRECRLYIKEHLYQSLTLSKISKELHISRNHLAHVYKRATGEMLSDRIRKEKIKESKQLLRNSSLSLNEIGHMLGFSSQSHFTDIFRKETGMTPGKFRNTAYLSVTSF
jgi:YesN/AraC family two-component response regulator